MHKFLETIRLHYLLGWTLLGLLLLLLALEGWRYGIKPSRVNNEQVIKQSLDRAADFFLEEQKELLYFSESVAATFQAMLQRNTSAPQLYDALNQFPDFWSLALYQNDRPVVWKGFALQNREGTERTSGEKVYIRKFNNIIYWESHIPFSVQDSAQTFSFDLYTRYRISQSNPLPIGDRNEFYIFNSKELKTAYPINFSIFNEPSGDVVNTKPLLNLEGQTVGIAYATANEFQQARTEWEQNTRFWRSIFSILCFIVLVFLLYGAADQLSVWTGLLLQLFFIAMGWAIFTYTEMASDWILALTEQNDSEWIAMVKSLTSLCINAIFTLIAAVSLNRKISFFNYSLAPNRYLGSLALATVFGAVNALSIPYLFRILYRITERAGIPLLDLRIFPGWDAMILYLALGMIVLALGITLIALNRLLFTFTAEHYKLSAAILTASFIISLITFQLYYSDPVVFNWVFFSSLCSFAVIVGMAVGYFRKIQGLVALSPLRKMMIFSLIIAALNTPVIYQASLQNLDEELWETAVNYAREEDQFAEDLIRKLLTSLETEFNQITRQDLQNIQPSLQARFSQTIQQFLAPEWNAYSFDLQLINTFGDLIADYSTDLNSPEWIRMFSVPTLKAVTELEQITKSTIRPVIQQPTLINQEDYSTFYRGWIPIFGSSEETPIAWILASIYKERPQFNKPIRAVMASLTYADWNTTYLMQKYENGNLQHSAKQGFTGYFPKYQNLGQAKLQALQQDSLIYLNESTSEYSYRTLLWQESDDVTIKVSTTLADYRVILFSFFRFSFTLLLAVFILFLISQIINWKHASFLGRNKRFQDRILDNFLLATLIFLGILVGSSHYAIKQQNQDIVRQELFDKLESLSEAIEVAGSSMSNTNLNASFSLDSVTTPLNVDATFYADRTVTESTTPQIYQQHLLPAALPFEIYERLFIQQQRDAYSTVNLAGEPLLIGYRSILDAKNNPVATVAIPTFLESPKYNQQLLETTSYLILIYLLVFGLFALGSTFISRKLTRPLVLIQKGLNKISSGDLNTTIPVSRDDEIGSLAKAYNNMVFRLHKLQKELASAEREAAWKEMAQQVAHEIKNPLTPMKLNVQHLERQLKTDKYETEELKQRIQKITANLIDQIQSLSNIASDFSKFSQPIEEEFTKVDLAAILSSVTELYQHDEEVTITFHTADGSVFVRGADDELKRVIINLVKNAYEAMPTGGKIDLRLYKKQHHAFIEIEDNGEGISEEDRANIFIPNFSTKSSGTGLGLAICKKIIEAHEGSITFASVEGEGTTFVIKLPVF